MLVEARIPDTEQVPIIWLPLDRIFREGILPIFERQRIPRLFKSQKRAKQETNGEQGLSIKGAHLLGDVGDADEIKQG